LKIVKLKQFPAPLGKEDAKVEATGAVAGVLEIAEKNLLGILRNLNSGSEILKKKYFRYLLVWLRHQNVASTKVVMAENQRGI